MHLSNQIQKSDIQNNFNSRDYKEIQLLSMGQLSNKQNETKPYKRRLIWRNIIFLTYVHVVAIYSVINIMQCKWQVSLFGKNCTRIG